MPVFTDIVGRPAVADALIPEDVSTEIIKEAPKDSVILTNARKVRLSTRKAKQPVLDTLPEAYWVDGDTGLKQTTKATWKNQWITAEELAVIVPIPDALVDDAGINLWEEVKPLIAEAIAHKIDSAAIFGTDKPKSWPEAIVPAAIKAGNTVAQGTHADLGADVAAMAGMVSSQGYPVNGFLSAPGLNWELIGMRDANGQPIYSPSMTIGQPAALYGLALNEVFTGGWESDKAKIVGLDWTKQVVGIRQDITYDIFREGVITDADGKVILNLMQQDTKALRVVMRVGWTTAAPATRVSKGQGYPAGVITPAKPKASA